MVSRVRQWGKSLLRKAGFHTNRHIVVFESDDWGSVRAPSAEAIQEYQAQFPNHQLNHYQTLDGLESASDVRALADVLNGASLKNGPARFTLNFAMANPVFPQEHIFDKALFAFAYEPAQATYTRYYPGQESAIEVLQEDAMRAVFKPQLHAREHLNATQWAAGARTEERLARAYELEMIGLADGPYNAMDALNKSNTGVDRRAYLQEAQDLFTAAFGFASESYIPPCYVADDECLTALANLGVRTIQGGIVANIPSVDGSLRQRINYTGKHTKCGQVNLARNCYFEPAKYFHKGVEGARCVEDTLAEISQAFNAHQVAIVCTHRVNYTSRINESNKDYSLGCLEQLLARLAQAYPDVEFLTSDELGKLINPA